MKLHHYLPVAAMGLLVTSCGMNYKAMETGSVSYSAPSARLSRSSVSTPKRQVVKTGKLDMEVNDVKAAAESLESHVVKVGGYMTSMTAREDNSPYAEFSIRVPSHQLIGTMDKISELGEVSYRRVKVDDVTEAKVRYEARLKELRNRRSRMQSLIKLAKNVEERLKVEEALAKLENEIFQMELAAKEQARHSAFSKLEVELQRKSINGPVGAAWKGVKWSFGKLFVIRE